MCVADGLHALRDGTSRDRETPPRGPGLGCHAGVWCSTRRPRPSLFLGFLGCLLVIAPDSEDPSPLWTSTSRTPTPVPRQPPPLHHVFGESLENSRLLADALGVLARFYGKQQEE